MIWIILIQLQYSVFIEVIPFLVNVMLGSWYSIQVAPEKTRGFSLMVRGFYLRKLEVYQKMKHSIKWIVWVLTFSFQS
jgi:hypothetical protein